jgi:hypothetical protein
MLTIRPLPEAASTEMAPAFEAVVLELLADTVEPLDVQFGAWRAEDGRLQFVCRVEGPPADAFIVEPQWRWWSALLDGPEDLRAALEEALERRRDRLAPPHLGLAEAVAARAL